MFNQPYSYEKLTLVTRQQELDRELDQIRRIKTAEDCRERPTGFRRVFEVIGWTMFRFGSRMNARTVECGCA